MNKIRREQLRKLSEKLSRIASIDDKAVLEECVSTLEDIKWDEEDYFDNMPENLQGSIRGCESEDAIDNMYQALDALDEAMELENEKELLDTINEAIASIDDCV